MALKLRQKKDCLFIQKNNFKHRNKLYYYIFSIAISSPPPKKKLTPLQKKKYPVDFDDGLKIGDVRYDDMT